MFLFGEHVERRMDEATANMQDRGLAQYARQSEFERLMGGDMQDSASSFADPAASGFATDLDSSGGEMTLESGY